MPDALILLEWIVFKKNNFSTVMYFLVKLTDLNENFGQGQCCGFSPFRGDIAAIEVKFGRAEQTICLCCPAISHFDEYRVWVYDS